LEIDFVRAASYGDARVSSGTVALTKDVETPLEGRRVLIVEDMIDSGRSLKRLRDHFVSRGAAEVCIVVLIDKKTKRAVDVPVEWSALESEDLFLLGYGLDDGERGRNLPDLWVVD
ncbi:MAG: hypoxanthine phosphoribosyltransferase, partial [Thermoguttaceae bacterium]|nr:hypoxanthine phosphoribosyltransferase [Thermoguttaceae bacterium]